MIHPWPQMDKARLDPAAKDKMTLVQDVVVAIRTLRSEAVIPPGTWITCSLRNLDSHALTILKDSDVQAFICSLWHE